ncbi:MAG: PocR ligand-binding domain-containing protein [Clostridia bacterium]|nr:PocR ligand-binding domain-containing protein [Clostridia bacterium]
MAYNSDFFKKKTQELLQNFYNLTGIKICLYDIEGNEVYYFPQKLSGFCSVLRKNSLMNERCLQCEKRAMAECKKTQSHYQYTCHAGLMECITPVMYNQTLLGYVMIGQIRKKGEDFDKIKQYLCEEFLPLLQEEYHKLPKLSEDKVNSAVCILDACAGYEYLKNIMNSDEQKLDVRIAGYVNSNLTSDLSVQKLCSVFRVSTGELYAIFKEYFSSTPADYVKNRRLGTACDLLNKSQLKVRDVCKKVGIDDYNYFSKIFKKKFGVSPTEYRKSFRI